MTVVDRDRRLLLPPRGPAGAPAFHSRPVDHTSRIAWAKLLA
jgi:hypothetical protein